MSGPSEDDVATRRSADDDESRAASRSWWDHQADDYLDEHGAFLGDARFVWCPEGLSESDAGLLGDVRDRRVLEVGCGAAQCARWLLSAGADPVALDLSSAMLLRGREVGAATGLAVPLVQADATRLPFADASFDMACSAYGAVPFVADSGSGHGGGGAGAPARRAVGVLGDASAAVELSRRPGAGRAGRATTPTGTGGPTSSRDRPGGRPTSSTIAPSATGSARSRRPA